MNSNNSSRLESSNNSLRSSPRMPSSQSPSAVVMDNSQYKRPSSILSTSSAASRRRSGGGGAVLFKDDDEPLETNLVGRIFLALHVVISITIVIVALIATVFEIISLALKDKIVNIAEVPKFVTFILTAAALISLFVTLKVPVWLVFGREKTFKDYCFKDNVALKYASYTNLVIGIICIGIHVYIYFKPSGTSTLTPFLPAGSYLILNSLLNLKLHRELVDGGMTEQTIMLPYVMDRRHGDYDGMMEEMSEITGSNNV